MAKGINWKRARAVGNVGAINADDAANLIIIEDNTEAIVNAVNAALVGALEKIGVDAEKNAKKLCPVDTGRLRNSITHQVSEGEKAVYIGTNVEYAIYVEMRDNATHTTGQAHFLRDAAREYGDDYRMIVKGELQNA